MVHIRSAPFSSSTILARSFLILFLLTSFVQSLPQASGNCGETNPFINSKNDVVRTLQRVDISGTVTILNDCLVEVSSLKVTGVTTLQIINGEVPIDVFDANDVSLTSQSSQLFQLKRGFSFANFRRLAFVSEGFIVAFVPLTPAPKTIAIPVSPSPVQPSPAAPTQQIVTPGANTPAATQTTTVPSVQSTPIRLLAPKLMFATVGPDANVPIGVSFLVNNLKQPNLTLVRGTEYTFGVVGGPTHPLYITTSSIGAKGANPASNETVFAGNSTTFGTAEKPGYVRFTPDANTPSRIYYQCWNHGRMGGIITVVDEQKDGKYDVDVTNLPPQVPPANIVSGTDKLVVSWSLILVAVAALFL